MPDGPWQELDAGTSDAWEAEYQDPDSTYTSPTDRRESEETKPDGSRSTTSTFFIANIEEKGVDWAQHLYHKCNRCGGHRHELRADHGFSVDVSYRALHVEEGQHGQGMGTLYTSVSVIGSLTRRVETRTYPPGGGLPTVDIVWEHKTLDHVEHRDLVVLHEFDSVVDCVLGVEVDSLGYAVPEAGSFARALARIPALAEDAGWRDEGDVLADLEAALEGVQRPAFRFVDALDEAEMVLEDRGGEEPREIGRVALEITGGGTEVVVGKYTPTGAG